MNHADRTWEVTNANVQYLVDCLEDAVKNPDTSLDKYLKSKSGIERIYVNGVIEKATKLILLYERLKDRG